MYLALLHVKKYWCGKLEKNIEEHNVECVIGFTRVCLFFACQQVECSTYQLENVDFLRPEDIGGHLHLFQSSN